MKEKTDRRVKYTKMVIEDSFIELLKTNPINKITVKAVCALADVNRSTFYKHYKDVYDVLEKIEESLYNKFKKILSGKIADPSKKLKTDDIFHLIADNKDVCEIILGENGDTNFIKKIIMLGNNTYKTTNGNKLSDIVYTFISLGSVGVIQHWINNGLKEPPEYIAALVENLTYNGISSI